jgi:hypothetical protein
MTIWPIVLATIATLCFAYTSARLSANGRTSGRAVVGLMANVLGCVLSWFSIIYYFQSSSDMREFPF